MRGHRYVGLAAAALLAMALGSSLYSWSLFVPPFEQALNTSRERVSLVFSVALVCFTVAMLFGPALRRYSSLPALAAAACLLGAAGLSVSAWWSSLVALMVGYGVLFGTASGIGYSVALQVGSSALRHRTGLGTGIVVAAYGLGPVLLAPLAGATIASLGVEATLYGLAAALLAVGALVSVALADQDADASGPAPSAAPRRLPCRRRAFALLWAGYAMAATAGLMSIGHAAPLLEQYGGQAQYLFLGPMLVTGGNTLGRLAAGWLSDILAVRSLLAAATGSTALALLGLPLWPAPATALTALGVIGFGYGAVAAGYPAAVARYYGVERLATVYGRLFTAWGVAGLLGPWLGGRIYHVAGSYDVAFLVAGAACLAATAVTLALPGADRVQRGETARPAATP